MQKDRTMCFVHSLTYFGVSEFEIGRARGRQNWGKRPTFRGHISLNPCPFSKFLVPLESYFQGLFNGVRRKG